MVVRVSGVTVSAGCSVYLGGLGTHGRRMSSGRVGLTRRRFLASSAALATTLQLQRAAMAAGLMGAAEVCRLAAEQEEGPFYVPGEMVRSKIDEGKAGVPLELKLVVLDARTCRPLVNAAVDLWHCDAMGLYAGFTKQNGFGPGGPPPPGSGPEERGGPPPGGMPPKMKPSDKLTFLRGIQMTDAQGAVRFTTVFPGFYQGRTNHIHFKVRVGGHAEGKSYAPGHTSHTGQVFFPEEIATELMRHEPYSLHTIHRTTQAEDGVFGGEHGELSVARIVPMGGKNFVEGMRAELVASVDPTAVPKDVGRMGPPPGR